MPDVPLSSKWWATSQKAKTSENCCKTDLHSVGKKKVRVSCRVNSTAENGEDTHLWQIERKKHIVVSAVPSYNVEIHLRLFGKLEAGRGCVQFSRSLE